MYIPSQESSVINKYKNMALVQAVNEVKLSNSPCSSADVFTRS